MRRRALAAYTEGPAWIGPHAAAWARTRARSIAWVLAVAVVAGLRRAMDGLATRRARQALERAKGISGDLGRLHVGLLPPALRIQALHIIEAAHAGRGAQLFCARAALRLSPLALLRGRIAAHLDIERSTVTLDRVQGEKASAQHADDGHSPGSLMAISPRDMIARLPAFAVDPIRVRRSTLVYRELGTDRSGELWIHGVQVIVRQLATRPELRRGRTIQVSGHGRVGRRGRFVLSLDANPQASRLTFNIRAELRGFRLRELDDFLGPKADLQIPEGKIDLFVVLRCRDGKLRGGVKPVLKDLRIEAADRSWLDRVKAWLTDKTIDLTSGEVEGHKAVATVFPILGTLDNPDIQLMPAILGVIRNAFVIGLHEGFDNLPPEMPEAREGFFKRTKRAFTRSGGWPKGQPTKEEEHGDAR